MPGAQWFPDARLNFAQNLLRSRDDHDALVFWGEDKVHNRMSHGELYREVARFAAALRDMGVVKGDRVAAFMPNMPETVIAMLAAASIGAIFTSASPDFGVQGVVDRFGQTEPEVLVAADGYYYNGKVIETLGKLGEIAARLSSPRRVVVVPYVRHEHDLSGVVHARMYAVFVKPHHAVTEIAFEALPFDHPLYIMYSSGTTGVPKGLFPSHSLSLRLRSDGRFLRKTLARCRASGATRTGGDRRGKMHGRERIAFAA